MSIDFNNDTFEDQVIGVKKGNNPNIIVIFGLYNQKKNNYERVMEVQTNISQVKTLNLMTMDLIGNHTNALIFTGIAENNDSVLQAYVAKKGSKNGKLVKIVDFQTDGSIFIQQVTRSDNYSIYDEDDESFLIVTNTTEEKSDGKGFDQIQTSYEWNKKKFTYTEKSSSRVSSRRLEAKELARIQDGTIETFANFLDGLWYKTGSSHNERGIFFNYEEKEIIFSSPDTQEVYEWLNSSLRRYGIFISSSNKSISNLIRYFHIDLISSDEIRIRVTDDVRMIIGTEAVWDGVYKKKIQKSVKAKQVSESPKDNISEKLEANLGRWDFQNTTIVFSEMAFTYQTQTETIKGSYNPIHLHNTDLIQFRADKKDCRLNGFFMYKLSGDRLDLIPVRVSAENCIIEGGSSTLRLEKYKTN